MKLFTIGVEQLFEPIILQTNDSRFLKVFLWVTSSGNFPIKEKRKKEKKRWSVYNWKLCYIYTKCGLWLLYMSLMCRGIFRFKFWKVFIEYEKKLFFTKLPQIWHTHKIEFLLTYLKRDRPSLCCIDFVTETLSFLENVLLFFAHCEPLRLNCLNIDVRKSYLL